MDIIDIDLFDLNVGIVCAKGRLRCFMDIIDIDLFDQKYEYSMCQSYDFRCTWISLLLIDLI